jgi:hypothetical protein
MSNSNRVVIHRSRTPSPKRREVVDVMAEFRRLHEIHVGNRLVGDETTGSLTGLGRTLQNPMEDPDEPMMPRTSLAVIFGLIIAASIVIACYLIAIVLHEYQINADVQRRIGALQDKQELILYNLTVIGNLLNQIRDNLLVIEFQVDELQVNLTSLAQRISDINCTGIRSFNYEITAINQFGHGGGNAWVRTGIPEFITVDTVNATITVNGTALQLLIDAQETSLQLLQALLSAVQAALAMLQQQTLLSINAEGSLGNNIDFVGHCNATFVPGNATVIIDGCTIRDEIDRQFQVVYAQFLAALAKIAQLKASIAYIELQIDFIEQIIANVTQHGLMTINGVGPGVGGSFGLASADIFLGVTPGAASNELSISNQALLTMNGLRSDSSG